VNGARRSLAREAFFGEIVGLFSPKAIWNSALLFQVFPLQKGGSNVGCHQNVAYSPPADVGQFSDHRHGAAERQDLS
jgi:hypothetical protein